MVDPAYPQSSPLQRAIFLGRLSRFGGALLALLVTGSGFSMSSVIGLLRLMGIVSKNSILLVEYAVVAYHQQGMGRYAALANACHKRAQPILMTTIAMAAGMLHRPGHRCRPSLRGTMALLKK